MGGTLTFFFEMSKRTETDLMQQKRAQRANVNRRRHNSLPKTRSVDKKKMFRSINQHPATKKKVVIKSHLLSS